MKANDRARLTTALRDHVAKIAADLCAKMRAPGAARAAAEQLHKDERVAEDFEVWADLLSRRAAVLWVLKSVYVRVLEDRGLLAPGRLLDSEAQQLFEKLAPNLGETAFLRWTYKDLASSRGGVPELFSPQPAEVALPSDELSRALIAFWRHRDADTGAVWSFAEERFEGELMGDLYQELDPVVKDRFALCQTPDFVRAFILDRTLTPAMETFGADEVRLLDPACGSGHFLIDGLKRLVAATAEKHKGWSKEKVVTHALDRVVGVDLNDYACALARTRLIMTAAELAGVTKLADAARFHPHVYWADGLEQIEKEELKPSLQFSLFEKVEERPRATLTRSDVRAALKKVFEMKFHAVVANPPYIVESDQARKGYHREKVDKKQRYVSAYRQYSLGSPFTERCFQLAEKDGYVGIIKGNNFLKREFGKPLIETVLAGLDVTLIADTSQAYIPHHGTPTVLIFGRNRRPQGNSVRAVLGKRAESGIPDDPAKGSVWASIAAGWTTVGFENDYVSVADLPRATLAKHPWSLGGGGASDVKEQLDGTPGAELLGRIASAIGPMCITKQDDLFSQSLGVLSRCRVGAEVLRPYVSGDDLRDWSVDIREDVIFPYDGKAITRPLSELGGVGSFLWRWRTILESRAVFGGGTFRSAGRQWWEYGQFPADRIATPLSIAFAFVATHNHFALDRGGKVFNRSAPVIKLPATATEEDHFALLGLLNSSIGCFWMKQVFHPKGATSANRNHPDPERFAHEFAATGLEKFPVPARAPHDRRLAECARQLTELGTSRTAALSSGAWAFSLGRADELSRALDARWRKFDQARQQMIFLQEEIDWHVYALYGLTPAPLAAPAKGPRRMPRGHRAFERADGRRTFIRVAGAALVAEHAECDTGDTDLPPEYEEIVARRIEEIQSNPAVRTVERYMYKRLWRDTEENVVEQTFRDKHDRAQVASWLLDRVEAAAAKRPAPFTIARIAADLMEHSEVLVAVEYLTGGRSSALDQTIQRVIEENAVPSHPAHVYTDAGQAKRRAWEEVWGLQRREDAGEIIDAIPVPPEYSQGSRGKSTDFIRTEYWRLRGKLDVPKERFIAFTEVPGRSGVETLYGWAGWTAQQRVKAILAIDEELEDASVPLADRIGLLDSAWRLLPDVAREDAAAATRLKAELQALVGPEGPSRELIEEWKKRFLPPTARAAKGRKAAVARKVDESEEDDE
ncbi:BREX-2 system adenine-specific DNA-methyltransferase PglX [Corallococcus exiguus]|uniref:BREX-2 system adenine-specific DNA-methyltransferase PglX n=1 Tax=Corallococcus exiguus TaxID=83462 RepID=UPI00149400EE|nr:BREX-2 system adenine-specific DNA-methyltransferase PglX [Corallococcus exiguus]NPC68928.1 BREX-2 system adenine-specific DNA-methyltransferase PglX [Corallococcus exiguus]